MKKKKENGITMKHNIKSGINIILQEILKYVCLSIYIVCKQKKYCGLI